MEIKVPSISCEVCVQTLTKGIIKNDPSATVEGDANTQTLNVITQLSEAEIKGIITKLGHEYV